MFIERTLFDGLISVIITKKSFGSVHPRLENFPDQIDAVRNLTDYKGSIALLRPTSTNRIVPESKLTLSEKYESQRILSYEECFDGVLARDCAVGICNADCPVGIALVEEDGEKYFVFLHLSLKAVLPVKNKDCSIIKKLSELIQERNLKLLSFWMGFGAKSCCYGVKESDERFFHASKWQRGPYHTIKAGPKEGRIRMNIGQIVVSQLETFIGFDPSCIEIDAYCTACGGETFSNIHDGKLERNFSMAWFN